MILPTVQPRFEVWLGSYSNRILSMVLDPLRIHCEGSDYGNATCELVSEGDLLTRVPTPTWGLDRMQEALESWACDQGANVLRATIWAEDVRSVGRRHFDAWLTPRSGLEASSANMRRIAGQLGWVVRG